MKRQLRFFPAQSRQAGVATLTVVLVLFFIVSMVAAYTNRNMIFEQRTGANQLRSTQAQEAAQAGLEWAKALLNGGRITDSCQPSTVSTDTTFRQRYLNIDANGAVTPRAINLPVNVPSDQLMPSCVFNGSGWNCDCPSSTAPSLAVPTGSAIRPAFRVRFVAGGSATRPGLVRVEAIGCTRLDNDCLDFAGQGVASEGRAMLTELLGLAGGLPSPPLAPLMAGGSVNLGGAAMALNNADRSAGGITVHARLGVTPAGLVLSSLPGTPGSASLLPNDGSLLAGDRMFSGTFNMWPAVYSQQPAVVVLDASTGCSGSSCTAAVVRTALQDNPGRVLWIAGDLDLDSAGDVGSATAPALLVVNGNLVFSNPVTVYGLGRVNTTCLEQAWCETLRAWRSRKPNSLRSSIACLCSGAMSACPT